MRLLPLHLGIIAITLTLTACTSSQPQGSVPAGWQSLQNSSKNISFALPPDWKIVPEQSNEGSATYTDKAGNARFTVRSADAKGETLDAYLKKEAETVATGWEGQRSMNIEKSEPMMIAGVAGKLRHLYLLAADLRQLSAVFVLGDREYFVTLHNDDGKAPTNDQETLMKIILKSIRSL